VCCVWHLFFAADAVHIVTVSQFFARLFTERNLHFPLKNGVNMNIYSAVRAIVGVSLSELYKTHTEALVAK
jgi:hypothetical protein